MSESNNNNHPKAEGKAKAPAGAKDDVEFVVHTKHTCDVCFEQPIIGRRYTSGDRSNFDLCARCFKDYSGPDIGLSETVMGESLPGMCMCNFSFGLVCKSNICLRRP